MTPIQLLEEPGVTLRRVVGNQGAKVPHSYCVCNYRFETDQIHSRRCHRNTSIPCTCVRVSLPIGSCLFSSPERIRKSPELESSKTAHTSKRKQFRGSTKCMNALRNIRRGGKHSHSTFRELVGPIRAQNGVTCRGSEEFLQTHVDSSVLP